MSSPTNTAKVTVREASTEEYEAIARLLHDAFISSREHRYFAGATRESPGTSLMGSKTVTTRMLFYLSNVRATHLLNGRIRVATGENGKVVGAALWLPPYRRIKLSPVLLYRSGFVQVLLRWGWPGLKRILIQWEDVMDAETAKRLSKKEIDSPWLLHMLAVDPQMQGKGVGSLILDDGNNEVVGSSAILLYCTERARAVYVKNGYVERGRWEMLSGLADEEGWPIKGKQRDVSDAAKQNSYLMVKPSVT